MVARLEVEVGTSPYVRSVTKFSSPPAGTPATTMFSILASTASAASSAAVTACCAALTCSLSAFASATRAAFSSFGACATRLPCAFCAARSSSKAVIGGTAVAVGGDGVIDGARRLPACFLRAFDQLGMFAQEGGIDHLTSLVSGLHRASRSYASRILEDGLGIPGYRVTMTVPAAP